jgi:Outer membrane protein beta-barrel domain
LLPNNNKNFKKINMRKFYLLLAVLCTTLYVKAQTDTTIVKTDTTANMADTIRIGNIIIIKKGGQSSADSSYNDVKISRRHTGKKQNVETNWGIFDLGFNNYTDNTNYSSPATRQFAPNSNENWFKLRNGKSINVNLWILMQRLNLIKQVINLKYGVGIELYNFRYDEDIRFTKKPAGVYLDNAINYSKNKLATDYVTVPVMLNFNFTPKKDPGKSFGLSAGVSGGYLYSSRQKHRSGETGKEKTKGNLGINDFKLAYIAEVHLGPVKLYGSLAQKSMFKKGLNQTPYAVGFRFSNW